jgi:hypothetical protein
LIIPCYVFLIITLPSKLLDNSTTSCLKYFRSSWFSYLISFTEKFGLFRSRDLGLTLVVAAYSFSSRSRLRGLYLFIYQLYSLLMIPAKSSWRSIGQLFSLKISPRRSRRPSTTLLTSVGSMRRKSNNRGRSSPNSRNSSSVKESVASN